MLENNTNLRKN